MKMAGDLPRTLFPIFSAYFKCDSLPASQKLPLSAKINEVPWVLVHLFSVGN